MAMVGELAMWLMELMWVMAILLMIGFAVRVNQQVVAGVKFKQEVMLLYSQLAQHRLYQKYGGGYYDIYDEHSLSKWEVKKAKFSKPYRTYKVERVNNKNISFNINGYHSLGRISGKEDYKTSRFTIYYKDNKFKPMYVGVTVNRIGALRIYRKMWWR